MANEVTIRLAVAGMAKIDADETNVDGSPERTGKGVEE